MSSFLVTLLRGVTTLRVFLTLVGIGLYLTVFWLPSVGGLQDPYNPKAALFALVGAGSLFVGMLSSSGPGDRIMGLNRLTSAVAAYSAASEWLLSATQGSPPVSHMIIWGVVGVMVTAAAAKVAWSMLRNQDGGP